MQSLLAWLACHRPSIVKRRHVSLSAHYHWLGAYAFQPARFTRLSRVRRSRRWCVTVIMGPGTVILDLGYTRSLYDRSRCGDQPCTSSFDSWSKCRHDTMG
jgi:hypothetical protein